MYNRFMLIITAKLKSFFLFRKNIFIKKGQSLSGHSIS